MIDLKKGDCLEVMKSIPNGSIDAIITDPPYGTTACKWDSVIDFGLMWEQLNRIIKPNGAIVLFGSEPFSSALRMSNIKNYKYDWIWDKSQVSNPSQAKKQPLRCVENICIFNSKKYYPQGLSTNVNKVLKHRGKTETRLNANYRIKHKIEKENYMQKFTNYPKNIIKKFPQNRTNRLHPTQKPILLMEYLIRTYTNENETVLDFTMGSGSTLVACQNTNRNGIGIEQDGNYFKIAQDRIEQNKYKLF